MGRHLRGRVPSLGGWMGQMGRPGPGPGCSPGRGAQSRGLVAGAGSRLWVCGVPGSGLQMGFWVQVLMP